MLIEVDACLSFAPMLIGTNERFELLCILCLPRHSFSGGGRLRGGYLLVFTKLCTKDWIVQDLQGMGCAHRSRTSQGSKGGKSSKPALPFALSSSFLFTDYWLLITDSWRQPHLFSQGFHKNR